MYVGNHAIVKMKLTVLKTSASEGKDTNNANYS
jgi:hypothetical protein